MKTRAIVILFALLIPLAAFAQPHHTVDAGELINAYMNVFELDGVTHAGGWGLPLHELAYFDGANIVLLPYAIPHTTDPWWYDGTGAPQKIAEGNVYHNIDNNPAYSGATVTFSGEVIENTFGAEHTVYAFIKDFAPDWGSSEVHLAVLGGPGDFSITADTIAAPDRHVQWGFMVVGPHWDPNMGPNPYGQLIAGPKVVANEAASWSEVKSLYR